MSDSTPRPPGRSSAVRARRSAVDHIADHGETHDLPELFDGGSIDAASISTSTFSIVPQALPVTIDEDLLEDDEVVASEVDPEHAPSASLDEVRPPVTDAPAPTPVVLATIDASKASAGSGKPASARTPAPRASTSGTPAARTPAAVAGPAASAERGATSAATSDGLQTSGPVDAPGEGRETTEKTESAVDASRPKRPARPTAASTQPRTPAATAKKTTAATKSAATVATATSTDTKVTGTPAKTTDSTATTPRATASKTTAPKKSTTAKTTAPKTMAPKTMAPKTTASKTTSPKTTASKTTASKTAAPETGAPKTSGSKTAAPKTMPPKTTSRKAPQKKTPQTPIVEEPSSEAVSLDSRTPSVDDVESPPLQLASDTIVVDLPPSEATEVPADERAVAIDEAPVTTAEQISAPTSSVSVVAEPERSTDRDDRVDESPVAAPAFAGMSVARALAGAPESSSMLTAERLVEERRDTRRVPEGFWQKLLFDASGRRIRVADSKAARARNALTERIARPLTGGARFVPVLTRKGGVGKTTVTTLLGMALADARDDRVIAVDANPDRGTLAERLARRSEHTVRDLVRGASDVVGYTEFSALVSRDTTRLDVLASDSDPHISQAFDEADYDVVARLASQYYSIILTDCGTGIVHSVMGATLRHADTLVIVSGTSVDEARSASETLSWLEANGYAELASDAVVVINSTTPGTPSVRLDEIGKHFESRVRAIVRVPFDAHLATGAAVTFADLRPETRLAVRELAAVVVEGLPGGRPRKAGVRG